MVRRGLITSWTTNPGIQVLLALLIVGTIGLLIRDLGENRSSWTILLRAATAAGWLTLLVAGQIGRRRQRRDRSQRRDEGRGR